MVNNEAALQEIFRIWPTEGDGAFLEVLKDDDGLIRIYTTDGPSEKYFGKINVSFEPQVAKKIGEALGILT